ncbi:MAG: sugar transferase [Elainella sp. Prado103]|jgi:lipopolysaccharide/colanic/teichoic acid biosynthesis glycosyltransferase|nr:sugar transferase [Elainella sp. Prado103]
MTSHSSLISKRQPSLELHFSVTSKLKRLIDILGAMVGLLILAIVLLPIALLIKLDSPGSVFYSQVRCGVHGRPFRIWKFRSMVSSADRMQHLVRNEAQGLIFKNSGDPRITRIGKFLRRTSLDELPQFWNVLRGEMSLVGTRPPTLDEVSRYQAHHWKRLSVKPGMTGVWQVYGRSTIKDFEQIVELDLRYLRLWSVRYDLELIVKTIWIVLSCRGAY